jgi:very-short-patch-repair endonuclease
VGRVDYYYCRLRLIVDIDSALHHTSRLDAAADARRDAALQAAGFRVLRITEEQLRERPWEVVALVRAALQVPVA